MLTAALTLCGAIVALLFYEMKRHDSKEDDPKTQNENRYKQIDQDIAKGDSNTATDHATADLDDLDRLQNASAHNPV